MPFTPAPARTYNRRTNAPTAEEIARAAKGAVLGIILGLLLVAAAGKEV
jgi:hypothetical protein